jgi:REP element-mobilizing transposase RayT
MLFGRACWLTFYENVYKAKTGMASKRQRQQSFEFRTWGGRRKGAGRPPKGPRSSEPHKVRVRFSGPTPAHVTLRVVAPIPTLRRPDAYHAIRHSMYTVVERSDFRIVHISIERNHLHLIVEADDQVSLWKGLRSFETSAAQRLNRAISLATGTKRLGKVFDDRYHARLITSPSQARNSISYVRVNRPIESASAEQEVARPEAFL